MAKVKEIHVLVGRTVSPANNKYEPIRFEHGVTMTLEDGDDPTAVRNAAKMEVMKLLMADVNMVRGAT